MRFVPSLPSKETVKARATTVKAWQLPKQERQVHVANVMESYTDDYLQLSCPPRSMDQRRYGPRSVPTER